MIEINKIHKGDCIDLMKNIEDSLIDLVLTDIPYNVVSRKSNGLRNLDKDKADILTFDLNKFLSEVHRVTKSTIIIFCAKEQLSHIYGYFASKKGTTRQLIWEKSNPSPMNGEYVYLSGIENAVWFKKRGGTFNARCKNVVFKHPNGSKKFHPTEKNHKLLKELILDNSNENDIVLDTCCGGGSHCIVALELGRNFIGIELDKEYASIASQRIKIIENNRK